ncbi:MAG: DUF4010 domain-containing protein [Gemmatimonadota bacterium]
MDGSLLLPLGIGLGLGLLVGLQREHAEGTMAGIRTFPLLTLFGVLAGALGTEHGGWLPAAGLLAVAAYFAAAMVAQQGGEDGPAIGLTTEMAGLLMYAVGVALAAGMTAAALVVGGLVAVLLEAKERLHGVAGALSDRDLRVLFQFVLVGLVILPVLPNRDYGPFDVLNPFEIWLMVVLIVGISVGAWAAYRILGHRRGLALTGILGGLISSTATTVSYSRMAREGHPAPAAAFVIIMASAVVFVRVLVEVAVVVPDSWAAVAPSMGIMLATLLLMAWLQWRKVPRSEGGSGASDELHRAAPSELPAALAFGLLYALVLLAVAAAREFLGEGGLYAVAFLSGLTDMDAITLSTAQLVRSGSLDVDTAWRAIVVGGMSNLVFKGGVVAVVGGRTLRRPVLTAFGVALAVGFAILVLG